MQKYKHYSDLHGVNPEDLEGYEDTICIIAGDLDEVKLKRRVKLIEELCSKFKLVIEVMGNHEHYGGSILRTYDKLKESVKHLSNHVLLENEFIIIDGVKIIGSTMWSESSHMYHSVRDAMNDYKYIRIGAGGRNYARRLNPNDTTLLHHKSVQYIMSELANWEDDCIVVTHHAPSYYSVSPRYEGDPINVAYATELDIPKWPNYWIHGHMHNASSYIHKGCNVRCNPGGYRGEVTGFDETHNYFYL